MFPFSTKPPSQYSVIKWLPRSPDLTPSDFYFIKNKVYGTRPQKRGRAMY